MVIHEDFKKLSGGRIIKTLSSRGGVALGNKTFVMLIGSEFHGNTFIGGLKNKDDFGLIHEAELRYYTTIFVYADTYIFQEDTEPFHIDEATKINFGTYAVYIGYNKNDNYMLLVRRI